MKFGLSIHRLHQFGNEPSEYSAVVKRAELLGFESVWVGDHLVFPENLPATYPYAEDGRGPHEPALPWLDPFITLSYLAASTERVKLGMNVYVLPLRNPFVTAKAMATLDLLSKGRAILGIGVGWLDAEFQAVGEDFHTRGSRCDEILEIMKALWTQDTVAFQGRYYSFGPVKFEPKPVQKPHPPIHYGGISPKALERTAAHCDGFLDPGQSLDGLVASMNELRSLRSRFGRDHLPFEMSVSRVAGSGAVPAYRIGPPQGNMTIDDVHRLEEVGVDRIIVKLWPQGSAGSVRAQLALDNMERFAEEALARV